jgi:hypothetical protein
MAALADVFRAHSMPWLGVTKVLYSGNGSTIRHPAGARLPAVTLV